MQLNAEEKGMVCDYGHLVTTYLIRRWNQLSPLQLLRSTLAQVPSKSLSLHFCSTVANKADLFLRESLADFDGGSSLGFNDSEDCALSGGQKIRIHVSNCIFLENAEVVHLLVEPSTEDSQAHDSLIFQLDGHGEAFFKVIGVLILGEIPNLDVRRVVAPNFGLDAIEVSDDGANVGSVAVLGSIEKIGGAIAEDDLLGIGHKEIHEGVWDIRVEDDHCIYLCGGFGVYADAGEIESGLVLCAVEHYHYIGRYAGICY